MLVKYLKWLSEQLPHHMGAWICHQPIQPSKRCSKLFAPDSGSANKPQWVSSAYLTVFSSLFLDSVYRKDISSKKLSYLATLCVFVSVPFASEMACKNTSSPDSALTLIPTWILKAFQVSWASKWVIFSWTAVQFTRYSGATLSMWLKIDKQVLPVRIYF